ncbi:MAG TPA: methionyl-tRNA formyltransferase [Candidatus Binatia bacterium]|jgi:methionyl-tRNA formyltransferase|nr:methionyl-tRNA formyltransferase [Candidatus Binatia bacterium]
MTRIVFMGTPEFSVPILQALIGTQNVAGVVTQPDRPAGRGQELRPAPVKVLAEQAHLPLYQPRSLRAPESAVPIVAWKPEAIVVAAFGRILRPHLLNLPPLGCINVHASLLPRWRGASPIQHAILAGDAQTGVSLMRMDEGLDTGPVYISQAITIGDRETAATLHDRLAALGAEMVRRHLPAIFAGELKASSQNDELATYAPLIDKEDGRLDWGQSAAQIDRHVRAMTPWPGAFTAWQDRRLKIQAARPWHGSLPRSLEPGAVGLRGEDVLVGSGDGVLQLLRVQLAGKRAMDVAEFLNGHPDFPGSRLSTS